MKLECSLSNIMNVLLFNKHFLSGLVREQSRLNADIGNWKK